MLIQELNNRVGKIFGLKEGELENFASAIDMQTGELLITLKIKADSRKAQQVKTLFKQQINGNK